jgi:ABC-type sugar transport system substrate-binding protein
LRNSHAGCDAQDILELPLSGKWNANKGLNVANNVVNTPPSAMVSIADDDIAAHAPSSLKQHNCKGEYIKFALLLKGNV